jgi:hypothetical protein
MYENKWSLEFSQERTARCEILDWFHTIKEKC